MQKIFNEEVGANQIAENVQEKNEIIQSAEESCKVSDNGLQLEPTNEEKVSTEHNDVLALMLNEIKEVDFREKLGLTESLEKIKPKHVLVCCVEEILNTAEKNDWRLCRNHSFIYLYNGTYYQLLSDEI